MRAAAIHIASALKIYKLFPLIKLKLRYPINRDRIRISMDSTMCISLRI